MRSLVVSDIASQQFQNLTLIKIRHKKIERESNRKNN